MGSVEEDIPTVYPAVIDSSNKKRLNLKNIKFKRTNKKQDLTETEVISQAEEENIQSENLAELNEMAAGESEAGTVNVDRTPDLTGLKEVNA